MKATRAEKARRVSCMVDLCRRDVKMLVLRIAGCECVLIACFCSDDDYPRQLRRHQPALYILILTRPTRSYPIHDLTLRAHPFAIPPRNDTPQHMPRGSQHRSCAISLGRSMPASLVATSLVHPLRFGYIPDNEVMYNPDTGADNVMVGAQGIVVDNCVFNS